MEILQRNSFVQLVYTNKKDRGKIFKKEILIRKRRRKRRRRRKKGKVMHICNSEHSGG
jgi:hypothetical protein